MHLIGLPSDFQSQCGLAGEIFEINPHSCTPYKLFNILISDKILEDITFQTNIYAEQVHQATNKRYTQTKLAEIKTFIGLNLLMGIKRSPSYRDYWSTDEDLNDPYISKLMPVNRFSWLLSHIHLNDNSNWKKTQKYYNPHNCIAIDESMIKFKGRSALKQYMPKKPIKQGYKIWALADSEGYLYNFDIYTSKTKDYVEHRLGERVVLRLMDGLEYKQHLLFFDNYFTTYWLELKTKGINACGTVMANRKNLPKLKEDKYLKQGEYDYNISNDGISI
uniref:PiggyBac transposable element-derived protein domain-containing protein n=1 Tax=Dendroctonus ponderosae TaxID=77166 RepID=A0AAR5QKM6_DENPD